MTLLELVEILVKLGIPGAIFGFCVKIWNDRKAAKEGDLCVLRHMMLSIYYEYKDAKVVPQYVAESFTMMYKAYKKRGGNSFIDEVYAHFTNKELEE